MIKIIVILVLICLFDSVQCFYNISIPVEQREKMAREEFSRFPSSDDEDLKVIFSKIMDESIQEKESSFMDSCNYKIKDCELRDRLIRGISNFKLDDEINKYFSENINFFWELDQCFISHNYYYESYTRDSNNQKILFISNLKKGFISRYFHENIDSLPNFRHDLVQCLVKIL